MKTNYVSMQERIFKATTLAELNKLESSLEKLFDIGAFSNVEFTRLDNLWCDRLTWVKAVRPECAHNWEHLYDFARCRNCGEDFDIPTASDYANDI